MIFTGEASGEMYGGLLAEALRDMRKDVILAGTGGDFMAGAGVELVAHIRDLSVMGFWEVLRDYPRLKNILGKARDRVRKERPDAVILVDFYRFNIEIARLAKELGIPVFYYVPPKLWVWGHRRIRVLKKYVDRVLAVFPFEEEFFRSRGMPVTYVGNPLMELLEREKQVPSPVLPDGTDPGRRIIGLLPGSRQSEIRQLLPVFLSSARLIIDKLGPKVHFILPLAQTVPRDLVDGMISTANVPLTVTEGASRQVLKRSEAAMVASGTATLEAFLIGTPQVVAYRTSPLTFFLARLLVRLPWVSLPNILAGQEVVEELVQQDLTPEKLAGAILELINSEDRKRKYLRAGEAARESLKGHDASRLAAQAVLAPFTGIGERVSL